MTDGFTRRVVLDTNIIVSALLQPLGPPAQIFLLAISGSLQLCMSGSIYTEYEEVISRPRFGRDESTITEVLKTIRAQGFWVRPTVAIRACPDPDDNIFLECAVAARASYLVTGNQRHFPGSWEQILVVTPRQLLDVINSQESESELT
jgi:putative PIN family toxin of toxin-antitoxin system